MTGSVSSLDSQFSPDGVIALASRAGPGFALQRIADRMRISIPDADPEQSISLNGRELKTCRLRLPEGSPSQLYLAGDHGRIIPFLNDCCLQGLISFPIKIVNFDFHADVDEYRGQHVGYTASWQRLGLHLGLFGPGDSINVRPPHSDAPPKDPGIVTDILPSDLKEIGPFDVVSIDLDYFNDRTPDSLSWREGMQVMREALRTAKVAMLFSSPGWTSGHLSEELVRYAAEELIHYCRKDG